MYILVNRDLDVRLSEADGGYKQFWKQICLFGEYVNPNGGAKMVLDEELNLKPSLWRAWWNELIVVADFVFGKIVATNRDDERFFLTIIVDESDFEPEFFRLNSAFKYFR